MRIVRASLLGVGITIALVIMLQAIGAQIWPYMSSVDVKNEATVRAAMATAPLISLIWVVAAYVIAGFVGSFLACKMSGGIATRPSMLVGGILLIACATNSAAIPQPMWMTAASLLVPIPAAWLGYQIARSR